MRTDASIAVDQEGPDPAQDISSVRFKKKILEFDRIGLRGRCHGNRHKPTRDWANRLDSSILLS